jgi:hypothetical protein
MALSTERAAIMLSESCAGSTFNWAYVDALFDNLANLDPTGLPLLFFISYDILG